jgi:hypothetical protein
MLSFRVDNNKKIQIDLDREGLRNLISVLEEYAARGTGHVHLRAPSAGGDVLTDKTPWGQEAVPEVIVTLGGD